MGTTSDTHRYSAHSIDRAKRRLVGLVVTEVDRHCAGVAPRPRDALQEPGKNGPLMPIATRANLDDPLACCQFDAPLSHLGSKRLRDDPVELPVQ